MRTPGLLGWTAALLAVTAVGCTSRGSLEHRAEAVCRRLEMIERIEADPAAGTAAPARPEWPRILCAPVDTDDTESSAGAAGERADPAAVPEPIGDLSFGQILKQDIRCTPGQLWNGTKLSFANPTNLIILASAFGADRIVRHNLDGEVRDYFEEHESSLAETGDFGSVIGNPALHFGIASGWYLWAVRERDPRGHEMSKVMIEALAVNGFSTLVLKWSMQDKCPNGERWGWPSGHTSSSVCFAAVMHEYYGWKAGLPLYLLAGYTAATRLEDREHDLSDLVFGAALGWVVGHSVVKGELPTVAGFHVLPYGGPEGGGLLFVKRW